MSPALATRRSPANTLPARISACARVRLSARPRATSSWSARTLAKERIHDAEAALDQLTVLHVLRIKRVAAHHQSCRDDHRIVDRKIGRLSDHQSLTMKLDIERHDGV